MEKVWKSVFYPTPALQKKYSLVAALPLRENVTVHRVAKDATQEPTFSRGFFRNIFSEGQASGKKQISMRSIGDFRVRQYDKCRSK